MNESTASHFWYHLTVLWRKALQAIWQGFGLAEHFVRFKSYKSNAAGAILLSIPSCLQLLSEWRNQVRLNSTSIMCQCVFWSLKYLISAFLFFISCIGWSENPTDSWPKTWTVPPLSFICLFVDWLVTPLLRSHPRVESLLFESPINGVWRFVELTGGWGKLKSRPPGPVALGLSGVCVLLWWWLFLLLSAAL